MKRMSRIFALLFVSVLFISAQPSDFLLANPHYDRRDEMEAAIEQERWEGTRLGEIEMSKDPLKSELIRQYRKDKARQSESEKESFFFAIGSFVCLYLVFKFFKYLKPFFKSRP